MSPATFVPAALPLHTPSDRSSASNTTVPPPVPDDNEPTTLPARFGSGQLYQFAPTGSRLLGVRRETASDPEDFTNTTTA